MVKLCYVLDFWTHMPYQPLPNQFPSVVKLSEGAVVDWHVLKK
jgi:hypothetical protein